MFACDREADEHTQDNERSSEAPSSIARDIHTDRQLHRCDTTPRTSRDEPDSPPAPGTAVAKVVSSSTSETRVTSTEEKGELTIFKT